MGTGYEMDELGALRKKPIIKNTYGKAPRRRQPKAAFTPITASESMSDEDPIIVSESTVTSPQAPSASAPATTKTTSPRKNLMPRDTRTIPATFQEIASSNRKRKISQIYKTGERSQPIADDSEEDKVPSAPEPRRSRITQPEPVPLAKSSGRPRATVQPSTSNSAAVKPRLSSPPPTPPDVSIDLVGSVSSRQVSTKVSSKEKTREPAQRRREIPLHLARDSPKKTRQAGALSVRAQKEETLVVPVPTAKPSSSTRPKNTRRRLIDVLVEQEQSDTSEVDEDDLDAQVGSSQATLSQGSNASEFDVYNSPETPQTRAKTAPAAGARTFARSNSALKFTYGQGRKLLEEEDSLLESLALPETSSYSRRRLDLGTHKKSTSALGAFDFDDDGTNGASPGSKLRDIYELRQAGANSRVADSMTDLIEQIGTPGNGSTSSRRTALFQVAEKMRDKTFIQQCRDHGVESVILKDIAKETDPICGYLIMSSIVTIMSKSPSAHMCGLLCAEEPGAFFARLLSIPEDIKKLAKDRKSNLSKRNQGLLTAIESQLRALSIWDGKPPSFVSPRGLATKCLQLLIAHDILMGSDPRVFTEAVTKHLFKVLSDASDDTEYYDYPKTAQSVELCSALSVLNVHAVGVVTLQGGESDSTRRYFATIADVLHSSLQTPARDDKAVDDLILSLTINLTNNNLAAPTIFAEKGLLPALAASVSSNLSLALTYVAQDASTDGIWNSLYLQLGILINFAEHNDLVRKILNECQHESRDPVKELIQLFIDNHCRTSEADSIQKTQLNVAFGYLSVLLGYLALHRPVREKLARSHSTMSIKPLIGAIREFMAHHKQVEQVIDETDGEHQRHGDYAEQLQELVQQLERAARG